MNECPREVGLGRSLKSRFSFAFFFCLCDLVCRFFGSLGPRLSRIVDCFRRVYHFLVRCSTLLPPSTLPSPSEHRHSGDRLLFAHTNWLPCSTPTAPVCSMRCNPGRFVSWTNESAGGIFEASERADVRRRRSGDGRGAADAPRTDAGAERGCDWQAIWPCTSMLAWGGVRPSRCSVAWTSQLPRAPSYRQLPRARSDLTAPSAAAPAQPAACHTNNTPKKQAQLPVSATPSSPTPSTPSALFARLFTS